jgi:hypothetical protein
MTADFLRLRLLFVTLAGWVNRHRQYVIEYLVEENHVFREQLRPPLGFAGCRAGQRQTENAAVASWQ